MIKGVVFVICLVIFGNVNAQFSPLINNSGDYTSFSLKWENDVMFQTDYYYTQGLSMQLINPFLEKNPINHLFFNPKGTSNSIYGMSLHQQMYTPLDIKHEEILYGDRPYAGVLYLKSFIKTANTNKKHLIQSEFDIGLIGPNSFADIIQYKFHQLSNNHLPNGWKYQIRQVPIINYNLSYYKGLFDTGNMDFMMFGKARAGSLYDDVEIGIKYRIGYLNSFFESIGEDLYYKNTKFQSFFTLSPNVRFVGYNATLQGNIFTKNHQTYVLRPDDIERIVYGFDGTISVMFKGVGISYQLNYQTPEVKNGLEHFYHSTTFIFRF